MGGHDNHSPAGRSSLIARSLLPLLLRVATCFLPCPRLSRLAYFLEQPCRSGALSFLVVEFVILHYFTHVGMFGDGPRRRKPDQNAPRLRTGTTMGATIAPFSRVSRDNGFNGIDEYAKTIVFISALLFLGQTPIIHTKGSHYRVLITRECDRILGGASETSQAAQRKGSLFFCTHMLMPSPPVTTAPHEFSVMQATCPPRKRSSILKTRMVPNHRRRS